MPIPRGTDDGPGLPPYRRRARQVPAICVHVHRIAASERRRGRPGIGCRWPATGRSTLSLRAIGWLIINSNTSGVFFFHWRPQTDTRNSITDGTLGSREDGTRTEASNGLQRASECAMAAVIPLTTVYTIQDVGWRSVRASALNDGYVIFIDISFPRLLRCVVVNQCHAVRHARQLKRHLSAKFNRIRSKMITSPSDYHYAIIGLACWSMQVTLLKEFLVYFLL